MYEYEQEGEGRILKFVPVAPEDLDQVRERWAFAAYLAGQGVRVCRPLSSEGGALLEVVQGEDRIWAVTLSVRMPGEHPERGADRRVGRAVGGGARIVRG